jgi:hypothetical protein
MCSPNTAPTHRARIVESCAGEAMDAALRACHIAECCGCYDRRHRGLPVRMQGLKGACRAERSQQPLGLAIHPMLAFKIPAPTERASERITRIIIKMCIECAQSVISSLSYTDSVPVGRAGVPTSSPPGHHLDNIP